VIEAIGWVGSFCFAVSALPQTIKTVRTKSAEDLSWGFLGLWLVGELCMLAYAAIELDSTPLVVNYICNLACLLPIIYYKYLERRRNDQAAVRRL
jgi:uncharacterized protein with PQ loop repeat